MNIFLLLIYIILYNNSMCGKSMCNNQGIGLLLTALGQIKRPNTLEKEENCDQFTTHSIQLSTLEKLQVPVVSKRTHGLMPPPCIIITTKLNPQSDHIQITCLTSLGYEGADTPEVQTSVQLLIIFRGKSSYIGSHRYIYNQIQSGTV